MSWSDTSASAQRGRVGEPPFRKIHRRPDQQSAGRARHAPRSDTFRVPNRVPTCPNLGGFSATPEKSHRRPKMLKKTYK
jgi:hypothetical protein